MVDLQSRPRSVLPPELDPRGSRTRQRRHRPVRRLIRLIALTLSGVVLVVSVGGYVVVKWFDGSIARVHLNLGQDRPAGAGKGSQNWLLVGTDNSATSDYGVRAGVRSDTTILAHLDADGTTTNLSFPRDSLVTIPAYTDPKTGTVTPEHKDKFNSAVSEGGPSLLVQTVEKLTDVRVDHYVSVDLDGFSAISKALNGVQVCILASPYHDPNDAAITNINDGYSGFHGVVGEQTVAGAQALAFVRQRHGLPRGDIDRIARQQQFLGSVFRAATQVKLLANPIAVARLLDAIKNSLTLDQHTSITDLEKLGLRLKGVDPSKISFETVPQRGLQPTDTNLGKVKDYGSGLELTPNGQPDSVGNVQIIDQDGLNAMLAKIKNEKPAPERSSATKAPAATPLTVAPSKILVNVENGVGRQGLAGTVTTALKQYGFQTGPPAGAGSNAYSVSVVKYGSGQKEAARTVAAAIPGATLMADNTITNGSITLILGQNYASVQPVRVGAVSPAAATGPPQPTPTAVASATPPPVTAASAGNRCTY